jgi:hypothetical protein
MRNLIILLVLFISCQNGKNQKQINESQENSCTDSIKYIKLISATIDLPNLQQYYRDEDTLKEKELIILDNIKFPRGIEKLKKFNNSVRIMKETEIKEYGIEEYLEYKVINLKNDTAYVYYRYDVQGIGIESTYHLNNCKWELIKSHLWEN